MKTRKLMAVLVMVALFVTALPVVALGAEEPYAVPGATQIRASEKADADDKDKATVTVYLRDRSGDRAKLATEQMLYIWAERDKAKDRVSDIDNIVLKDEKVVVKIDGKKEVLVEPKNGENWVELKHVIGDEDEDEDEVVVFNTVEVKYTSRFEGKVNFYAAIIPEVFFNNDNGEFDPDDTEDIKRYAVHATTVFEGVKDDYSIKLVGTDPEDRTERADGTSAIEVELEVLDKNLLPIANEKVNFSTSSRHLILNKDSAVSNSKGVVKVKATSERPGDYILYAKIDSYRKAELAERSGGKKGLDLKFTPAKGYDIKVKKGDGAVIALDEAYTFEFEVFDIFGRAIKDISENKNHPVINEYIDEIEVISSPSKATFEKMLFDGSTFKKSGDVEITWTGALKIKATEDTLDKEGTYVLRVKLTNGKYATAKFEVKEQGDIVGMTLEYDPAYTSEEVDVATGVALRFKTKTPKVKLVDADGIAAEVSGDNLDLEFSVNNTRVAKIHEDGVVEQRYNDSEGVVVVTVVHTDHNLAATAEVRVGEVGVAGIKFLDVPDELLVDEEYTIKMKVLDEDGHEIMKGSDYKVVVLSKPSGAKVELDEDGDKFTIYSDTKGQVKLIATARKPEEDKAVSGTLTLDFVTERAPVVEGKVFLTIGANFGLVDGVAKELDAPAFIEDGRTFVPVRFLAEAFGAVADYEPKDAAVETVTLTRDDMEIVIGIGDEFLTVTVDDEADVVTFDGAARIVDGRTFLPFRAIAEAFDAEVDYGPKEGLVQWVSFE